jgi:glycosyltransferase involved in cell wall biosynthesis
MSKAIHIITRLDMGGSAQNTLLTCLGLSEKYNVTLAHGLSHESHMTGAESRSVAKIVVETEKKGVNVIPLSALIRKINPIKDLRAFISLWRLIIREKPAIVHTHSSKAGILGRWAAKMAGVRCIIHTPHGHVFYGHFGSLTSRLFLLMEKLSALITDCMIALTEGEKKDYIELLNLRPASIEIIHSGVDINRYMKTRIKIKEKKISLGLNPKKLVVGTVGWLLSIKGPMVLLKAMGRIWQKHSDVELVYVGKGELEEELKTESFRMGVSDSVTFLGWRNDVHEIMPVFDLFVLPSLNEGMGRVLVEAMASGKPVVGSNVGGIPDLIKNGHNGFLVEPGDEIDLSVAIEKVLTDTKMRDEMGRKGKTMARNFGVERMVEKIDDLYATLLQTS